MSQQAANSILMVRPSKFRNNEQTQSNNSFQDVETESKLGISVRAQKEFDDLCQKIKSVGVDVVVIEDTIDTDTPDALFPNNWISFHENGDVVVYPLYAENRRLERREDVLDILEKRGFTINNVVDYSEAEGEGLFLEGTGSMVLDRLNRKAYLSLSERSDEDIFIEFCEDFEYTPVIFQSFHKEQLIYHTNVMMSVGSDFAIVCIEAIKDKKERKAILGHLKENGKEIIAISIKQMESYLGNVLELRDNEGGGVIVMSTSAHDSLNSGQKSKLEEYAKIIHNPLPTIEKYGGGGARCMIAEVFLPKA